MVGSTHQGVDTILDFSDEDRLDLHDFLKSASYESINEVVTVAYGAKGSLVSVMMAGQLVDVVMLSGVHGLDAEGMLATGMILA